VAKKKPDAVRPKMGVPAPTALKGRIGEGGTVGALIDRLKAVYDKRARARAVADALTTQYGALEAEVLAALAKQKLAGGRGRTAQASIGSHVVPNVVNWAALYKWALKNKDLSIFHRRVSSTHWGELIAAKKTVPGINPVTLTVLSLTKVK
jgi:hypothetical protein